MSKLRILLLIRTDDDKWRFTLEYKVYSSEYWFNKATEIYLNISKTSHFHYNFYEIKNDNMEKILYIHDGLFCPQ